MKSRLIMLLALASMALAGCAAFSQHNEVAPPPPPPADIPSPPPPPPPTTGEFPPIPIIPPPSGVTQQPPALTPPTPVGGTTLGEQLAPYATVKVFYATDRSASGLPDPSQAFGPDRGQLSYGTCDVSIPRDHRMGALESPSIWKLEVHSDPAKHVTLLSVNVLSNADFFAAVTKSTSDPLKKEAFIFVHGFNVSFEDAARRTAQMAYDLGFAGVPTFFSWPSKGRVEDYLADEATIEWAQKDMTDFLINFASRSNADKIYVIAHSMGNRGVTRALIDLADKHPDLAAKFSEIILTAPDIDSQVFREQIAPVLIADYHNVTLYASSTDRALEVSRKIHDDSRAGDSGSELTIIPGMETIDATNVDTSLLGHSYFGESTSVMSDIFYLIRGDRAINRFGLEGEGGTPSTYWAFKH